MTEMIISLALAPSASGDIDGVFFMLYNKYAIIFAIMFYVYSFETMSSSVAWNIEDFDGSYKGFLDDIVVYKDNSSGNLAAYNMKTAESSEIPY
ncbi:MAG: hypothetical protein LUE25_04775 [Clostridiales bacterium]|nr:hypothetical protein [Clostridiales bacterium]